MALCMYKRILLRSNDIMYCYMIAYSVYQALNELKP